MNAGANGRALLALLAGSILIGLGPSFLRLSEVGPMAAAFWRCALATPLLWLLARREAATPSGNSGHRLLLAGAGVFFAIDLALWHSSLGLTSVANSTLLASLSPLFVTPAAWLLWRERIGLRFMLGVVLALLGTAILIDPRASAVPDSHAGDALAVTAAASFACYLLVVSHLRRTESTVRVLLWTSAVVSALLLPAALLAGETLVPASLRGWAMLAGLALVVHLAGGGLITQAMASLPAAFSAVALLMIPLAAAVFAWIFLGEAFGVQQAVGGAVILSGIVLCRRA